MPEIDRRDPNVTSMILQAITESRTETREAIAALRTETRSALTELRAEMLSGLSRVNERLDDATESRVKDAEDSGKFKSALQSHHERLLRLEGHTLRGLAGLVSGLCALILVLIQLVFTKKG